MLDSLKKRLAEIAEERGMSFREISIAATGTDYLIKNWFRKGATTNPRIDSIRKVANVLDCDLEYLLGEQDYKKSSNKNLPRGLIVAGTIQAGNWVDASQIEADETQRIPLAANPKYEGMRQYALKVKGESMNLFAVDGSYVICVDYIDFGMELKTGMRVHVERSIADGQLVEATLKKVSINKNLIQLEPESTLKKFEKLAIKEGSTDEVAIKGIVIGRYQQEDF